MAKADSFHNSLPRGRSEKLQHEIDVIEEDDEEEEENDGIETVQIVCDGVVYHKDTKSNRVYNEECSEVGTFNEVTGRVDLWDEDDEDA